LALNRIPGSSGQHRAFVKAVSWRAIGTLDTFLWSWLITREAFDAGKIASLETVTKVALFYVHERVWRLFPWGADSHVRSVIKAVTWRLVGSLDTFLLSLLITGKLKFAVSIASAEVMTKIVLYYLHERAWRLVPWGRLESDKAKPAPAPALS
jgi:uncharacterized membrane protein